MYFEPVPSDDRISEKIKELKAKRNGGTKLTDKEIIELARLIRTLASRKYRQRQHMGKSVETTKHTFGSTTKD